MQITALQSYFNIIEAVVHQLLIIILAMSGGNIMDIYKGVSYLFSVQLLCHLSRLPTWQPFQKTCGTLMIQL